MNKRRKEPGVYEAINAEFEKIARRHKLENKEVRCKIIARGFSASPPAASSKEFTEQYFKMPSEEYALTKGKEVILRCEFEGYYGDAFTDEPKPFIGKISDVENMPLENSAGRGVYFATLNAVFSSLGFIRDSVHCKKGKPEACGKQLAKYIADNFGEKAVVAHIGYQPGHVEACSKLFKNYVTDLNPENIGKRKFGNKILSGDKNKEVIGKADVASITGSTVVNGSLPQLLEWCNFYRTQPIVYGVTVSAAAKILKLRHYCPYARSTP